MKQKNNYNGVKIMSLLFPIVGLIIYATNVKKDDELAKIGAKWGLIGLCIIPAFILIIYFIFSLTVVAPNVKNTEYATIPNVENMTINQATEKLETAGFIVNKKYEKIADNVIDKGNVVKTEPQAYRKELTGTKITLYISTGEN